MECHFDAWEKKFLDLVKELHHSLYVDDLLTGGHTIREAHTWKEKAVGILSDATFQSFQLHKWHSNVKELERDGECPDDHDDQSFVKQQFGVKSSETKMLALEWNKADDTLTIKFPEGDHPVTRREILSKLAKIYDPLGLVSPSL